MKFKRIMAAALAAAMLPTFSAYAETTYTSASELIADAISVATTGVTSTTYDTAVANMQTKLTVSGDEVFYDGVSIGYWYSDDSDTIWTDTTRTSTVLTPAGDDSWEFEPDVLEDILTDFNTDLIETLVPTTKDWSKIIGKYDVTLGDVTIPADQWTALDLLGDDYETSIDMSRVVTLKTEAATDIFFVSSYVVDNTGALYISDDCIAMASGTTKWDAPYFHHFTESRSFCNIVYDETGAEKWLNNDCWVYSHPYIRIGLHETDTDGELHISLYYSDLTAQTFFSNHHANSNDHQNHTLYSITDATQKLSTLDGIKQMGVFVMNKEQLDTPNAGTDLCSTMTKFFDSQSSSKQQIGNAVLKKRLSKFSSLEASDTITVTLTGWTVNGLSDFDEYLGTQGVLNAGDTANIAAVADAEALAFYVVTPTSLPIYMDSKGIISVADNATIENKSAAAVVLTDVQIEPKADTGWTMVDTTPSKQRDANEFTFATSLVIDTKLDIAEIHPFTYAVDLSPTTDGFEQLDLASVLVTVDWAEVTP